MATVSLEGEVTKCKISRKRVGEHRPEGEPRDDFPAHVNGRVHRHISKKASLSVSLAVSSQLSMY